LTLTTPRPHVRPSRSAMASNVLPGDPQRHWQRDPGGGNGKSATSTVNLNTVIWLSVNGPDKRNRYGRRQTPARIPTSTKLDIPAILMGRGPALAWVDSNGGPDHECGFTGLSFQSERPRTRTCIPGRLFRQDTTSFPLVGSIYIPKDGSYTFGHDHDDVRGTDRRQSCRQQVTFFQA